MAFDHIPDLLTLVVMAITALVLVGFGSLICILTYGSWKKKKTPSVDF
ncbi:MAG: hypothetical protein ABSC19_11915 [Syntrophorhabdales bacterium]|jgi:hypothetical protein